MVDADVLVSSVYQHVPAGERDHAHKLLLGSLISVSVVVPDVVLP
jgi:hypothetical protein